MHKIERIRVAGFWDTHDFETTLHPDVTFFIGVNGTGKTTLINLVAAVLFGDFPTLERMPFSSIEITLSAISGNKKPTILVSKRKTKARPFDGIQYKVRESQSGEEKVFSLDELSEHLLLRGDDLSFQRVSDYYLRNRRNQPRGLAETIQNLVSVSWLSIHRISGQQRHSDDKSYESTVDRKLEQQANDLLKYFSFISQQKDEEVRRFQELIFLSLLDETASSELFDVSGEGRLASQRAALTEIFRELNVAEKNFESRIQNYFGHSEKIYEQMKSVPQKGYSTDELANLLGLIRLNNVVDRWQQLQTRLAEIFAQRDRFLSIVNQMYQKKSVSISPTNEMVFLSRSEKPLSMKMLSSGEKQLLILLAEALLQRGRPYIFIADEPELSLHVTWQEKLVSSLTALNSSAQIIVATHSPDIIGGLSNNVIDMETLIK